MMALAAWIDRVIVDLLRQMRRSFLPPLMKYLAVGAPDLS